MKKRETVRRSSLSGSEKFFQVRIDKSNNVGTNNVKTSKGYKENWR